MYKYIIVGDPHATSNKLEEINRLFDLVVQTAKENHIHDVIVLGDLFDTHQIVHLPVMHNYLDIFKKYSHLHWVLLVGNHDIPLHGNRLNHALAPFSQFPYVKVVDGFDWYDDIDLIPYCSEEEFFKLVKNKRHDTLICHQTFMGAAYENNYFAKDGFDLSQVPYQKVISGHIHTQQSVGKCFYPGAPRWFKSTDANHPKSIWLWDGKDEYKAISTENVCQSIVKLTLNEGEPEPDLTNENKRYILEVNGSIKFINKITKKYGGMAQISSNLESTKDYVVKESVGVMQALENFVLTQYKPQFGFNNVEILEAIQARLYEP